MTSPASAHATALEEEHGASMICDDYELAELPPGRQLPSIWAADAPPTGAVVITPAMSAQYANIRSMEELSREPNTALLSACLNVGLPNAVRQLSLETLEAHVVRDGQVTFDGLYTVGEETPMQAEAMPSPLRPEQYEEMKDVQPGHRSPLAAVEIEKSPFGDSTPGTARARATDSQVDSDTASIAEQFDHDHEDVRMRSAPVATAVLLHQLVATHEAAPMSDFLQPEADSSALDEASDTDESMVAGTLASQGLDPKLNELREHADVLCPSLSSLGDLGESNSTPSDKSQARAPVAVILEASSRTSLVATEKSGSSAVGEDAAALSAVDRPSRQLGPAEQALTSTQSVSGQSRAPSGPIATPFVAVGQAVWAQSMTPVDALKLLTQLPVPTALELRLVNLGPTALTGELGDRLGLIAGARHDLPADQIPLLRAALLVVYDICVRQQTGRAKSSWDLDPDKSLLFPKTPVVSVAVKRYSLDVALARAACFLAKHFTTIRVPVPGVTPQSLGAGSARGVFIDWTVIKSLVPASAHDERLACDAEDAMTRDRAFKFSSKTTLSFPDAAKSVLFSRPDWTYFHPDLAGRCDRSYETVLRHPSYQTLLTRWKKDLRGLMEKVIKDGYRFEDLAGIYTQYGADEGFNAELVQAWHDSCMALGTFGPVTMNLKAPKVGETFSTTADWPVYVQWISKFAGQFNKSEGRRIYDDVKLEIVMQIPLKEVDDWGPADDQPAAHEDIRGLDQMVAFLRLTKRDGSTEVAISDGQDLGSRMQLYQAVGQELQPGYLPPACDSQSETVLYAQTSTCNPAALTLAQTLLEKTTTKLVDPVAALASEFAGEIEFKYSKTLANLRNVVRPEQDDLGSTNAQANLGLATWDFGIMTAQLSVSNENGLSDLHGLEISPDLLLKVQDTSADVGHSQAVADAAQRSLEMSNPWRPLEVVEDQGAALAHEVEAAQASSKFRSLLKILARDSKSLAAGNASYGRAFTMRSITDSLYLVRNLLNRGVLNKVYTRSEAKDIWSFLLCNLSLAAVSQKPAMLADGFSTYISNLAQRRNLEMSSFDLASEALFSR